MRLSRALHCVMIPKKSEVFSCCAIEMRRLPPILIAPLRTGMSHSLNDLPAEVRLSQPQAGTENVLPALGSSIQ